MATHSNFILKMQKVYALAKQHYEAGNQSKCYKAVWRYHIYPVYPMCYQTFINYINAVEKLQQAEQPAKQPVQTTLF